jgi:hypothetical protein
MQPVWLIDRKHNEQKNAMRCDVMPLFIQTEITYLP